MAILILNFKEFLTVVKLRIEQMWNCTFFFSQEKKASPRWVWNVFTVDFQFKMFRIEINGTGVEMLARGIGMCVVFLSKKIKWWNDRILNRWMPIFEMIHEKKSNCYLNYTLENEQ